MIAWLTANWYWLFAFFLWVGFCVLALKVIAGSNRTTERDYESDYSEEQLRKVRDWAKREHTDVH